MSNQSLRQASVRDATGTSGTIEEDWLALFDDASIAAGTFSERFYAWLLDRTGLSGGTLDELMHAFAVAQGVDNWDALGTFDAQGTNKTLRPGAGSLILSSVAPTVTVPALPEHDITVPAGDLALTGAAPTIDVTELPAPTIDLTAGSDRGASTTDDITNDPTPTFSIDIAEIYVADDHVLWEVNTDGGGFSQVADHTLTAGEVAAGVLFLGLSPLSDGTHVHRARMQRGAAFSDYSNEVTQVLDQSLGAITSVSIDDGTDATSSLQPTLLVTDGAIVDGTVWRVRDENGVLLGSTTADGTDESNGFILIALTSAGNLALGSHTVSVTGDDGSDHYTADEEYTFTVQNNFQPAAANLVLGGFAPSIGVSFTVAPGAGDLALSGAAPTVSVEATGYTANAVNFDGTNDYLTRGAGLTGAADGKLGIFVAWLDFTGGDAAEQEIVWGDSGGARVVIRKLASNALNILLRNSAGSTVISHTSTTTYTAASGWISFMAAWDAGNAISQMYVGDTSVGGSPSITDDLIDYTNTNNVAIGSSTAAANKLNADVADLRLWIDQTLDLSVESNRRKFIDASGKPVDPTTTGLSTPIIDLRGATATWHTNQGSGDGFTENGELTDGSSSPSD